MDELSQVGRVFYWPIRICPASEDVGKFRGDHTDEALDLHGHCRQTWRPQLPDDLGVDADERYLTRNFDN